MTEYWVSQARYHCKICDCWLADNRVSRQHHDSSASHKIKADKLMKQKRDAKLHGARSEQELQKTLQEIEQAARASMTQDRLSGDAMYKMGRGAPPPPPTMAARPALPALSSSAPSHVSRFSRKEEEPTAQMDTLLAAAEKVPLEEESTGMYTIRDITYLEGNKFENKLRVGVNCEVFVDERDDWFPVESLVRKELTIPNTALTLLSFEIVYLVKNEDGTFHEYPLTGVKSDQLRIIASEEDLNEIHKAVPAPPVDNNTGIGGWQTVAVRTIDEEQERESHEKAVEAMRNREVSDDEDVPVKDSGPKEVHTVRQFLYSKEPTLYKGTLVEDIVGSASLLSSLQDEDHAVPVQFVKRRRLGGGNARQVDVAESKTTDDDVPSVAAPVATALDGEVEKTTENVSSIEVPMLEAAEKEPLTAPVEVKAEPPQKISFSLGKPMKNMRKR